MSHQLRRLVLVAAIVALLATALATPALAISVHQFSFVNGIPGKRVDVCVDGTEVKSRLRYGGKAFFTHFNDVRVRIKFHPARPGTCRGAPLARKVIPLTGNDDLTVVATRKSPKVVVFDNTGLGIVPVPVALDSPIAIRHAADIGPVTFRARTFAVVQPEEPLPTIPTADPVYRKGMSYQLVGASDYFARLRATRPNRSRTIVGPKYFEMFSLQRTEVILVGTNLRNARFIVFYQDIFLV